MREKRVSGIKRDIFGVVGISTKPYEDIANNGLSNCQEERVRMKWIGIYHVNDSDE